MVNIAYWLNNGERLFNQQASGRVAILNETEEPIRGLIEVSTFICRGKQKESSHAKQVYKKTLKSNTNKK